MVEQNATLSLLPSAGGTIIHMSGGSNLPGEFNPTASLLPVVSAPILTFSGGVHPNEPIRNTFTTIRNNGSEDGYSNQCMLISILDHLRYRTNDPMSLSLKQFRTAIKRTIQDLDTIWPGNKEYSF